MAALEGNLDGITIDALTIDELTGQTVMIIRGAVPGLRPIDLVVSDRWRRTIREPLSVLIEPEYLPELANHQLRRLRRGDSLTFNVLQSSITPLPETVQLSVEPSTLEGGGSISVDSGTGNITIHSTADDPVRRLVLTANATGACSATTQTTVNWISKRFLQFPGCITDVRHCAASSQRVPVLPSRPVSLRLSAAAGSGSTKRSAPRG